MLLVSGFFEPIFYLFSIGIGLNHLVGDLSFGGRTFPYTSFVAPGLLATAAMDGALLDATFNLYFKLKISKTYDAVLATPLGADDVALGELLWSVVRGVLYATIFLGVMACFGTVHSWWALLCVPAALVMGAAFGAVGMAVTTFMRTWQDFDLVSLAIMPMFLFSATFYPLTVYPTWLQYVVASTPLYQGVALARGLALGAFSPLMLVNLAYLIVMVVVGLSVASSRMRRLVLS
jgi:lipooligosaccharide transport system permease protein